MNTSVNAQSNVQRMPGQRAPAGSVSPEAVISPFAAASEAVIGTQRRQGAISRLGNQLMLRQGESAPGFENTDGTDVPISSHSATEVELENTLLVQSFQAANPAAGQSNNAGQYEAARGSDAANRQATRRRLSIPLGILTNQWTMTTTEDGYASPEHAGRASLTARNSQPAQDWSVSVPQIVNPFRLANESPRSAAQAGGVQQAALLQEESIPEPAGTGPNVVAPTTENAAGDGKKEPTTLSDAEKVGEEPEDTSLEFLRATTVLLDPGESQLDVGIEYVLLENEFPILLTSSGDVIGVEDVEFRIRELTVPIQYRFGLLKRLQAFVGGAVGWSNAQASIRTFEEFENDGGFGDIDFGGTLQLVDGNAEKPHMLVTVSGTAPTGGDPFGGGAVLAPTAPSLGQGFWSVAGRVICIHSYDPLVFFYGVGSEHFFAREFNDIELEPGTSWNYSFGVGFAVNERVTLSTRFLGAYVEELRANRERILGTNSEPMTIRMAATISKPKKNRIVEPFVEFGLTDAAVTSYFGVGWTF
jgi:hypothetical protein